jgi:hypothetical protein
MTLHDASAEAAGKSITMNHAMAGLAGRLAPGGNPRKLAIYARLFLPW